MSEQYLRIYEYPNSNLKQVAAAWISNFDDPGLQSVLDDMLRTCKAYRGAGLAGPQVGLQMRVVVVLDEVYINPVITGKSKVTTTQQEGCLSFPGVEVSVERSTQVEVSYFDRHGKAQVKNLRGFAARCMQHEVDHLDGKTFLDHLPRFKRNGFLQRMKITQRKLMAQHKKNVVMQKKFERMVANSQAKAIKSEV